MLVLAAVVGAAQAQSLEASGVCPEITWSAAGLTPGGPVVLMTAPRAGSARLEGGPCAGRVTNLSRIGRAATFNADEVGGHLRAIALTGDECSRSYQLLDVTTCRMSNVVQIAVDGGVLAGSYQVGAGPAWDSATTAPMSCVAACAAQFGGDAADYFCSTRPDVIDHLAFGDGWGDDGLCHTPQPDDQVFGASTACSGDGCYYSAWVADHGCTATNWCFLN